MALGFIQVLIRLTRNSIAFAEDVLWSSIILIGILVLVGLTLLELRAAFFKVAPTIIHHSHAWVAVINAVRLDFFLEIEAIRIIVYAVKEALRFISAGRFPERVPKLIQVLEPTMLNASSLRQDLKVSTTACQDIGGGWDTVAAGLRARISPSVCPVLRAAWPLGAVNTTVQTLASWLSYDPNPQGNNCNATDYDISLTNTCMVVNSGLIVLQVILPAVLLFFVGKHFLKSLLQLVGVLFRDAMNTAVHVLTFS